MSRSQMEIFGLVIIVLLVSIALLFAVFVLTRPAEQQVARTTESIVAANFLNTMFSTSAIGCGKRTVRDLVQDCAVSGVNAARCENGMSTCVFAEKIIAHMLNTTMGRWGKTYQFEIEGPPSVERLSVMSGQCRGEVQAASRPEKVRAGFDITVTLKLC